MSHRKAGVRGLQNQKLNRENFQKVGQDIQALQYDQMTKLMNNFKSNLEEFAAKHSVEIRKNSKFRSQFQLMCSQLGVDPLASNKGFWTQMLGFGDFYYEVSVQVAQVCISTREINGGFIGFDELKEQVQRLRGSKAQPISEDDIVQSIKCLKPLGDGYSIVKIGTRTMVRSVPEELNTDHVVILELAEKDGYVTVKDICHKLKWDEERVIVLLDSMLQHGILWIDEQAQPHQYWISGLFI